MNLVQVLESQAKDCLDRIAIIEEGKEVSYRELWQRVDRLAKAFLNLGIKEGDRIAICLPNCQEYIYAFFASLKINAIAVPLKQSLTSYELKTILKDCKPSLFFTDNLHLRRMLPFEPSVEAGKLVICNKHILRISAAKRAIKIEDLFKSSLRLGAAFLADDSTVASINYTYRGYGYPLGAMLTHGNYRTGAEGYVYTVEIKGGEKTLLTLPMFHIFPFMSCIIVPLFTNGTTIILHNPNHRMVFEEIDKNKINVVISVPVFYLNLLKNFNKTDFKLNTVSCIISGSDILPLDIFSSIKENFKWEIRQGYGLTECMPIVCNPILGNRPETLGKVGFGVKVKIIDEKGNEKKPGDIGEIVIGGPTVMKGYYNKQRETEDVLKDGWCYSGDYGYFDKKEFLYFSGLKKRITKVGGNMVDLVEVKNTVDHFPDVIKTEINAMADEIWGNVLNAEIYVKNPEDFNTGQLRIFLRDRLSSYKIPRLKIIN